MATQNDQKIMVRMYKIIMSNGKIRRHELLDKADVSITQYYHVKGVFEERYENMVQYDKETKIWSAPNILIDMQIESERMRSQTRLNDGM